MNNELSKEIIIEKNLTNDIEQNKFLESTLGKAINAGIDIGIRSILPDYLEEQVIDLKDNLMKYGLKDGIEKSIEDAIDLGKSIKGIVTGNFENIGEVQQAIKTGGLIDNVSNLLDDVIYKANKNGILKTSVAKTLKQGKSIILNNVEKNIEQKFNDQIKILNYMEKYMNNWKKYFNNKDFSGMEKEYNNIEKQINNLIPIEKTLSDVRTIENLHNLIKNNGQDFNLTNEELELANKLK